MHDYAKMTDEQKGAYADGLADAIEELQRLSRTEHGEFTRAILRVAADKIDAFRNTHIEWVNVYENER